MRPVSYDSNDKSGWFAIIYRDILVSSGSWNLVYWGLRNVFFGGRDDRGQN